MDTQNPDATLPPPPAPFAARRIRLLVAGAAIGALIIGFLTRPVSVRLPAVAEEAAAPILQQVVEQREALASVRGIRESGLNALRFSARVTSAPPAPQEWSDWNPAERPQVVPRYGVAIAPNQLLVSGDGVPGEIVELTTGDGLVLSGRVTARFPARGLVTVTSQGQPLPVPRLVSDAVDPGSIAIAVAPGDPPVLAPLFIAGSVDGAVLVSNVLDSFVGMPVFLENGDLAGIVARTAEGPALLTIPAAIAVPAPAEPALGLSLRLVPPESEAPDALPLVEVVSAQPDGRAAAAGLREGDTLLSLDGMLVAGLADAIARLNADPATAHEIRVRRGRRTVRLTLPAVPAP